MESYRLDDWDQDELAEEWWDNQAEEDLIDCGEIDAPGSWDGSPLHETTWNEYMMF